MAGDWIKVEISTPDKPEIIRIADLLGIDQDAALGKCLRVWIWADQQTKDGNALSVTRAFLNRYTACEGFAEALREVGWLMGGDGNMKLPNFTRHNGISGKTRALGKERAKRFRNGASVTAALPEKRREETNTKDIAAGPREGEPASPPQSPKPPRPRNELFDAIATAFKLVPESSDGSLIGKVAASLKAKDAKPDDIARRMKNYRTHFPDCVCTATAIDKHWALCSEPKAVVYGFQPDGSYIDKPLSAEEADRIFGGPQ